MHGTIAARKRGAAPATYEPDEAAQRLRAGMSVRVVHSLADMAPLAPAWDGLASRRGSPMQTYLWAQACAERFLDAARLRLVVVESGGIPVAIAPFVLRSGCGAALELLGVRELYEPMDLLYADAAALARLADAIANLGLPIRLGRIPADSPAIAALQSAYRGRGWVHSAAVGGCPCIELGPEWREPESRFSSRRRSDFRRAERHAREFGELDYEVLAPRPAELPPLLDEAYRVEAAGWKGERGSALGVNPVRGGFFRSFAAAASAHGILRLCFLRVAGQAIAMQLAAECGERFWLLKIGYDERFANCSPGNLLMLHTLRYAAGRNLRSYEFLGAEAPWTQGWTRSLRPAVLLRSYPLSPAGLAALGTDALAYGRTRWTRLLGARAA